MWNIFILISISYFLLNEVACFQVSKSHLYFPLWSSFLIYNFLMSFFLTFFLSLQSLYVRDINSLYVSSKRFFQFAISLFTFLCLVFLKVSYRWIYQYLLLITIEFGVGRKGLSHVTKVIFTKRTYDGVALLLRTSQWLPSDLAQLLLLAHKALHMSSSYCSSSALLLLQLLYIHGICMIPGLQQLEPCPVHLFLLFTPRRPFCLTFKDSAEIYL